MRLAELFNTATITIMEGEVIPFPSRPPRPVSYTWHDDLDAIAVPTARKIMSRYMRPKLIDQILQTVDIQHDHALVYDIWDAVNAYEKNQSKFVKAMNFILGDGVPLGLLVDMLENSHSVRSIKVGRQE